MPYLNRARDAPSELSSRPRSSMDRAFGFYPKGCRFKSCRGHHLNSQIGCASIPPEITSVTLRGVCIVYTKAMQGKNRWLELGILAALLLAGAAGFAHAETGQEAWLRYAPLEKSARSKYKSLPANVVALGDSAIITTAQDEIVRGITGMLGRPLPAEKSIRERAIILGTVEEIRKLTPDFQPSERVVADGFLLTTTQVHGFNCLVVTSTTDRGVLYGVFALLSKIARNENVTALNQLEQPQVPIRWIDQWDNLNGTIERGYAGPSIFFEKGQVRYYFLSET